MTTEQRLDSIDTRLSQLVEATTQLTRSSEQQGRDIERLATSVSEQAKSVERLAGAFGEQARAIASLSQTVTRLVDAAQRSAQASEAAAVVAQDNQNAIRDLIEELRQERNR